MQEMAIVFLLVGFMVDHPFCELIVLYDRLGPFSIALILLENKILHFRTAYPGVRVFATMEDGDLRSHGHGVYDDMIRLALIRKYRVDGPEAVVMCSLRDI